MSDTDPKPSEQEARLSHAYERMLERTREFLSDAGETAGEGIRKAVDTAKEKAVELGELTHDEAETVAYFVTKDLHAAGDYVAQKGRSIAEWFTLGVDKIGGTVVDVFSGLYEKASVRVTHLRKAGLNYGEWKTGEITGPGTLQCTGCGQKMTKHKVGPIPPCPKCHNTTFKRTRK